MVHRHRSPTEWTAPRAPGHGRTAGSRPRPRCPGKRPRPGRPGLPASRHCGAASECTGLPGGTPGPAGARGARVVRTADVSRGRRQRPGPHRVADPVAPQPARSAQADRRPVAVPARRAGGPRPRLSPPCPLGTADRAIPDVRRTLRGAATGRYRLTRPGRHGPRTRQCPPAPERRLQLRAPGGSHPPAGPLQVPPRGSRAGAGGPLSRAGPVGGRGPPPWAGCAQGRPRSPPAPRSCRWG